MPKVFNVTIDGNFVIVTGQKGIVFAGLQTACPDELKDFVKFIISD